MRVDSFGGVETARLVFGLEGFGLSGGDELEVVFVVDGEDCGFVLDFAYQGGAFW